MRKRKLLPFVLITAFGFTSQAQTATSHIISSGGNDVNNAGKQLTYTIGEVLVSTYKAGANTFTQGFNQPSKLVVTSVSDMQTGYTLNTYPNPSQDIVNIDINGKLSGPLSLEMFDSKGSKITPLMLQNDNSKIRFNMQGLPTGYYYVRLVNSADHSASTIKIAKIQ